MRRDRPTVQNPREWGSIIRAIQGNFDHLMGLIRSFGKAHNALVDDVQEILESVEGNLETVALLEAAAASGDVVDHAHDGSGSDGGSLAGLHPSGFSFPGDEGEQGPMGPPGLRGGGGSATTVEVNLGTVLAHEGKFTITDAGISGTSKVLCWQAPGPYTGKGTRADEASMAPIRVLAAEPAAGSALVRWDSSQGFVPAVDQTSRPLNEFIPVATGKSMEGPNEIIGARVVGFVRGNIKFSYLVFA